MLLRIDPAAVSSYCRSFNIDENDFPFATAIYLVMTVVQIIQVTKDFPIIVAIFHDNRNEYCIACLIHYSPVLLFHIP